MIDFARARIAWTTRDGSHGLWRVIAAARRPGDGGTWFLAAGVMAGDVYGHGPLPLQPPYSFQLVASFDRHVIFRQPLDGPGAQDASSAHADIFRELVIDAPEIEPRVVALDDPTLPDWPLAARMSVCRHGGEGWALEFPVNHINLRGGPTAWQVETGPLIVPCDVIDIPGAAKPGGVQLAFVFFNRTDQADLLAFGEDPVRATERRGFRHFARLEGVEIGVFAP